MSISSPPSRVRLLAAYLLSLWPLPVFFTFVQAVMLLNGNSHFMGLPFWISDFDMLLFLLCFSAVALWVFQPLLRGGNRAGQLDSGMAQLPLRALRGFILGGFIYGIYLLLLSLYEVSLSHAPFSALMTVSLVVSIFFCALVLVPALGVAITLHFGIQQRLVHPPQADSERLQQWNSLHSFTNSSTRPWLVFFVTGFVPTSVLALLAYLASMEMTLEGKHFIAGQGLLVFFAGLVAGLFLIWLISRSLKLVTHQLSLGLQHLRQGRFSGRIAVLTDDDLGELASGLNTALSGLQEREELKGSLAVAAEIQHGLRPEIPQDVAGYVFAALEQSCFSVGGDYYDFIRLPDGRFWIVVADVAGKGYPAALTVANVHAMLHVLAEQNVPFDEAVLHINRSLFRTMTHGRFVTLFIAKLQPESHSMLWLNAGHVPPLLQHAGGIELLQANTPPLGILPDISFEVQRVDIAVHDRLFAYTDGVTEMQKHQDGEMFGLARLQAWLRDAGEVELTELPERLFSHLREFSGDNRDDDMTILCLEREEE